MALNNPSVLNSTRILKSGINTILR
ncbi:hypothetical protein [Xenorhabdus poinarii]